MFSAFRLTPSSPFIKSSTEAGDFLQGQKAVILVVGFAHRGRVARVSGNDFVSARKAKHRG